MLMAMLAAVIAVVIAAILFVRHRDKTAEDRKLERYINKYSVSFERDVVFSNGVGGYFFIDYLMLLPRKIVALNLPKVQGYVFGGENIETWTQVENNKTTKFKNPIEEVNLFVKHAADLLKFDGMKARVLFNGRSEFPKGVPEGVMQLANLKESLIAWAGETPAAEATNQAWEKLSALLAESRERYNKDAGSGQG